MSVVCNYISVENKDLFFICFSVRVGLCLDTAGESLWGLVFYSFLVAGVNRFPKGRPVQITQ